MTARHFSASASAIGSAIRMAALATTMSTRPNSCTARSNSAFTSASCVTSTFMPRTRWPVSLAMAAAVALTPASFTSAMSTAQPSRARRWEMAWPSPCAPPVTMATLSWQIRAAHFSFGKLFQQRLLGLLVPAAVLQRKLAARVPSTASASARGTTDRR